MSRGNAAKAGVVSLLSLGLVAVACAAPSSRSVPDFDERFARLRTVTLVPPKVAVYRLTAGGIEEEVQDWSESARHQLIAALEERARATGHLEFMPYVGPDLPGTAGMDAAADQASRTPLEETWTLYEAIAQEIFLHTFPQHGQLFPGKQKNFDYTLGREVSDVTMQTSADAFLIVAATDHVATAGRRALIGVGVLAAAVTGIYVGPGGSPAMVILALVDSRSGDILWFNAVASGSADLRKRQSDDELVELVMKGLDER
jgi:hypothetical protein